MSTTTPSAPAAVTVVGAGTMGHGLAVQFARHGAGVTLVDHRQSNLDWARDGVDDALAFLDAEGLLDAAPDAVRGRIDYTLDLPVAASDAALVIESVSEDLDTKAAVFGELAAAAPADAVLATNTSGIPITDIGEAVPAVADRIVGCHWWNPPYLLPTVEVVRGEATSDTTVDRTAAFVEAVGRDPIVVERDVPGFVWNRIQFAVLRECTHLVTEGVASLSDVERAVRDGYALRTAVVGPFETVDLAGLDLFRTIAENLYPHLSDATEPGPLFEERLAAGRGGVEDGAGFHEYDDDPATLIRRRDERVAAVRRALADDD
ncbi:3-hydroxyacyl-CoA dehydrogenase family protein [Haloplanus pelagicus]|jgi:3-hydroxybutyryl-CoA dehydrogenase|uniref:3-hydroxyacyl-CoA dehydrogenase family protein n=1 Tax=Haloplanus pelagicus TaxID=2949995 RepID=UPI0020412AEC|nr:3-hydroxyacyl-CoA dehydrogenase NAD-binding domain-containing protein [Haloplanus sp. HW8-1]